MRRPALDPHAAQRANDCCGDEGRDGQPSLPDTTSDRGIDAMGDLHDPQTRHEMRPKREFYLEAQARATTKAIC